MCGILCSLGLNGKVPGIKSCLLQILKNRGPNVEGSHSVFDGLINFFGFVLWQQGNEPFAQPAISDNVVLLLNGDIFNAPNLDSMSDTEWLLKQLNTCTDDSVFKFLTSLEGPYSVIFYNTTTQKLYFARDQLGRNSLIIERDCLDEVIKIASTSSLSHANNICVELPPVGLYILPIQYNDTEGRLSFDQIELLAWNQISPIQKENIENVFQVPLIEVEDVNFSKITPSNQSTMEYFNFYEITNDKDMEYSNLLENKDVCLCVDYVTTLLKHSLYERITKTPKVCENCIMNHTPCNHSKIGILFSGGLDCSILARLSDLICDKNEPIDLINVSFQNINSKDDQNIDWNSPDRITAIKSYNELRDLVPERKWNLILVNVTRNELSSFLANHIKHLIHPLNTVLDESLGASFWFASRGKGLLDDVEYKTSCRVILVGSGADEMFGGYTRHRNAFNRTQGDLNTKLEAINKELKLDWDRIAFRNLGRDDRVIADNCKTARSPYIDENFVDFVTNLKPEQKCCFKLAQGKGEKLLLRLVGFKLGLHYSSSLPKRAIQFGSKLADKKQNATDISKYLIPDS